MARNKIMKVWYWSLNSEWTYMIEDNTLAGGTSSPLPLTYVDSTVPGEISILDDLIYTDFIDVSMIILNPLFAPSGESLYLRNNVSFMLDDYVTCFDIASLGSFAGGGSVDLTPVLSALTAIQTRVDMLPDFEASSSIVSSALQSLDAVELNNLHEDIVSLGTQLSTVTVPLQSLNGNGCEFIDGTTVTVYGRDDVVYSVSRSYMAMIDDNSYTAVYDLESVNGAKCTAPESLLTLYVAPVVTTP